MSATIPPTRGNKMSRVTVNVPGAQILLHTFRKHAPRQAVSCSSQTCWRAATESAERNCVMVGRWVRGWDRRVAGSRVHLAVSSRTLICTQKHTQLVLLDISDSRI